MKLKFKIQPYQTNAVESVVDCFSGQLRNEGISYRIDPGKVSEGEIIGSTDDKETGFKN